MLVIQAVFLTFIAVVELVPRSLTHTCSGLVFLLLCNRGSQSYLSKSCTSVIVTAMQVEWKDCWRETHHGLEHDSSRIHSDVEMKRTRRHPDPPGGCRRTQFALSLSRVVSDSDTARSNHT